MISKKMNKKKVVLGLSGGVDSTAAALLLQEKGYQVTGLYFDIFSEGESKSEDGRKAAELAAKELGIKFVYRNVSSLFRDKVIGNFCSEYARGRTPNPCIVCNPEVKFKILADTADEEGAAYIATGHYADTYYHEESGTWYIRRAANRKKDQSYMLYRLSQNIISRLLLPLNGAENKEEVRNIARKKSLNNAEARDSQEICFIGEGDDYRAFLVRNGYEAVKGDFVDKEGRVLGQHRGIYSYTIGQRKGLGIALGKPAFVTRIDGERNQVVLGENDDLFKREIVSSYNVIMGAEIKAAAGNSNESKNFSFSELPAMGNEDGITAKIRYAAKDCPVCVKRLEDGRLLTVFEEPQRAATPGQSIVFYKGELVIGGGFID